LLIISNRKGKAQVQEYIDFTKDSIVNCNKVFVRSSSEIIAKIESQSLKIKSTMDIHIVERLRDAALSSELVERGIKELLK